MGGLGNFHYSETKGDQEREKGQVVLSSTGVTNETEKKNSHRIVFSKQLNNFLF